MIPRDMNAPLKYNSNEPCDMDDGPCCCGAWHERLKEHNLEKGYDRCIAEVRVNMNRREFNPHPRWHICAAYLWSDNDICIGRIDFDTCELVKYETYNDHLVKYWEFSSPGADTDMTPQMVYPTQDQFAVYDLWVLSLINDRFDGR